jgi:hypothetical protein
MQVKRIAFCCPSAKLRIPPHGNRAPPNGRTWRRTRKYEPSIPTDRKRERERGLAAEVMTRGVLFRYPSAIHPLPFCHANRTWANKMYSLLLHFRKPLYPATRYPRPPPTGGLGDEHGNTNLLARPTERGREGGGGWRR